VAQFYQLKFSTCQSGSGVATPPQKENKSINPSVMSLRFLRLSRKRDSNRFHFHLQYDDHHQRAVSHAQGPEDYGQTDPGPECRITLLFFPRVWSVRFTQILRQDWADSRPCGKTVWVRWGNFNASVLNTEHPDDHNVDLPVAFRKISIELVGSRNRATMHYLLRAGLKDSI
jgi:hypothetical protein